VRTARAGGVTTSDPHGNAPAAPPLGDPTDPTDPTEPTDPADSAESDVAAAEATRAARRRRARREWLFLIVATVLGTVLLRTFVVQSYRIPSGSMEKTLHGGCEPDCTDDRILVDKLSYKLHGIHRGDVVVFKATTPAWVAAAGGSKDVVKRVIGLPNDVVQCCDAQGNVVVNGTSLHEPYIYVDGTDPKKQFGPVTVPPGQLFVMGDHRNDSSDSRYNGTIAVSTVVGHAVMRVWPLSRLGFL
jgi:signal peptidase I